MIELSNIIEFIGFTIVLVLLEWWIYNGKRALMVIPVAMFFSAIITLVWNIL